MTAEIAILNRHGLALAADSAVTIQAPDGTKVYNTVNKLFALSRHAPVAAMVYGQAELSSVPWETIIKVYRQHLGDTLFPRLAEYAGHLIAFLDSPNDLFPNWQQEADVAAALRGYCSLILGDIDERIQQHLSSNPTIQTTEIDTIVTDVVAEHYQRWSRMKYQPGRNAAYVARIVRTWSDRIDQVIDEVLGKLTPRPTSRTRLRRLAGLLFAKEGFPEDYAGLVVAGFGEREHFPSIVSYDLHAVVADRLKYRQTRHHEVGNGLDSIIVPFAQREMVSLFMEGIDPEFGGELVQIVQGILEGLPKVVLDRLRLRQRDERTVRRKMEAASKAIGKEFGEWLEKYSSKYHVNPVIGSVGTLPKEELAAMAEALVNLTSFKRRVTHDIETVGGPIDVAVISKGDGLIWIKRKHYFDPMLNPHFMANYSR